MVLTDVRIRERLRKTWRIFFGRWGKLTDIQRLAIPFIFEKESLLLNAPTASGKTEAVLAPLIEMALQEQWPPGAIVYITPTRALVNDLYHRLRPLAEELGLTIVRRTGDFHELRQDRRGHVNLLTPESLDSILCRFPAHLLDVRAIILDELHMIDGTARGEQLRLLMKRFTWVRAKQQHPLLRFGLSATVPDPVAMGRRYLGDTFKVVRAPHRRMIELISLIPITDAATMARQIVAIMQKHDFRKVLLFANAKSHAEEMATALKTLWGYPDRVYVHHGRLDRRLRLEIEKAFHDAPVGICVATSTLEVGVDIGGIDAVGLLALPHSHESFVQRVGRGRRRFGTIPVFAFYRDDLEASIYRTYLDLVNQEVIPEHPVVPLPLAYLQQLLSYIVQKRRVGTSLNAINRLWDDLIQYPAWKNPYLEELLNHLERRGWIVHRGGLYFPSDRLHRAFERGWIHSTIDEVMKTIQIVDEHGRHLTEILTESLPVPGSTLIIGGRPYRVQRVHEEKITVRPVTGSAVSESAPYPTAPPLHWHYTFGRVLLNHLFPGLPDGIIPVQGDTECRVIHGFGYILSLVWSHALADHLGWKVIQFDGIQTVFKTTGEWPPTWVPPISAVRRTLAHFRGALEHWYGENRYYALLTSSLRQLHLLMAIRWFPFEAFLNEMSFARVKT